MVKNRWVAVAEDRVLKPNDFPTAKSAQISAVNGGFCPFCQGNEAHTPHEITACRPPESAPDGPGWLVRAIPNKFSAFEPEGTLAEKKSGIYRATNGLGRHEVIIETPEHGVEFHELSAERIGLVLGMLKRRYNDLAADGRIKYIQIYKNQGLFAGASLKHTHSQIVGLPFVPAENEGLELYYNEKKSCLLCDIIKQEKEERTRLVHESDSFIALCPYASRFPYEVWIVPLAHQGHFGDLHEDKIMELASLLKDMASVIMNRLEMPSYNLIINTAPVNSGEAAPYHWYMELTPRMVVNAGVEIATGVFINPVSPELAAGILKEALSARK
jgi:UDPglucose--hexose-1-phosphate uridylyltransferase